MNMNRAFCLKGKTYTPQWHLIDANGEVLGRLATRIADLLRGKKKATFTPHLDGGDFVVVINADKVILTGNKEEQKVYYRHSGWVGGRKERTIKHMREHFPCRILEHAVKGMLPKGPLGRQVYTKLKVYAGSEHPHHQAK